MICLACHAEHDDAALQCPRCRSGLRRDATDARTLPETAVPQRNAAQGAPVRSEAEIQAEIVAWLRLHGWDVTVTSAHRHAKGVTAGTPDLYVRRSLWQHGPDVVTGRLWIEVKRPGGRVSIAQAAWHDTERLCGGTVIVAYGIDDVRELAA